MKDLLRWEMKQTLRSKAFWGMGIAFLLCVFLFLIEPLYYKASGYDMFLLTMNNFNTFVVFFTGIYAGIHITKAFESRNVQAAVMAGNSRFSVLAAKLISYAFSIATFCSVTVGVNGLIGFMAGGIGDAGGNFWMSVIMRSLVFTVVEVAFSAICVFISMFFKNLGGAIAVNLITLLALNIVTQLLISQNLLMNILPFTPAGQTFLIFQDFTPANLMTAAVSSIVFLFAILGACFLKFRKAELK